jgi:hypothetical protein
MTQDMKYRLLCKLWDDIFISVEEVENLLENGSIEPNDMILWAVLNGREDLVGMLLEKGANPSKRGYNDELPALFRAVELYSNGYTTFGTTNLLMKAGANPHHIMEWYDGNYYYHGTIAVVIYKAFGINILKAA